MRIDARELKPYSEPVPTAELCEGRIYFSVHFFDEAMLIPSMEPLVFVGRDLEEGDAGLLYFQDVDSYWAGVRIGRAAENDTYTVVRTSEAEVRHVFEFENALDVLLACSIRRQRDGSGPR